ncbi:MAG: tetratricopeptide repeat protein [Pyrinomonadaceae bacterium]
MSHRIRLGAAALATVLLFVPCAPVAIAAANINLNAQQQQQDTDAPPEAEQSLFNKGQSLYTQGRFEQAVGVLKDFLKTYPQSSIADLTLLWLGRSYMELGRLPEAEQIGQRLRTIKDTPFADIYESELQKARRDVARTGRTPGEQPGNTSGSTVAPSAPRIAAPKAMPTPIAASNVPSNTGASATRNQRPVLTSPANSTQTGSTVAKNANIKGQPPQPRLITTPPPVSGTPSSATPTGVTAATNTVNMDRPLPSASRRGGRGGRQQRPVRQMPPTQNATDSPTLNKARQPGNAPVNNTIAGSSAPRTSTTPNSRAPLSGRETTTNTAPASTASSAASASNAAEPAATTAQGSGLNLTVKQVPGLALALRRATEAASPGQTVRLPLTITNTGNKEDQFRVDTDLPAEYQPTFSLAPGGGTSADTNLPILITPQLARGASVEVALNLRVPETAADGQQRRFVVRAASQANNQVTRISDGSINVVAAALAAISNVSQASVMPGGTFTQTITVRNSGSSPARLTRTNFVFNPDFELVSANPAPTAYDPPSRTAIWLLGDLGARDSRDISVTLRALPEALAASNSLGRGTVSTQSLPVGSNFDSPSIVVGKIARARVDAVSVGLTATPGDTIYIPFVVRNPGNSIDSYELKLSAPGAPMAAIYADTNADGQHQESEPAVTQTAPIAPQGGQYPTLLRVQIPANTPDRQQYSYNVVARSLTSSRVASEANTVLTVATPRVRVRTEQVADTSAPGDAIYYRLVLINEGSGLAKNLTVTETLPNALQFAGSEPTLNPQDAPGANAQSFQWRVSELAPGDTSVLRIAVRLRPNLQADTNLTTRHSLTYKDSNGNSYQEQ